MADRRVALRTVMLEVKDDGFDSLRPGASNRYSAAWHVANGPSSLTATENLTAKGAGSYAYSSVDEITNSGYGYDAVGNLLTRGDPGGTTSLGYNPRNQTTSINPDGQGAQALSYLTTGQQNPIQTGNAATGGIPPSVTDNALGISSQTTAGGGGQTAASTYITRAPNGTLLSERTPILGRSRSTYHRIEGGVEAFAGAATVAGGALGFAACAANPEIIGTLHCLLGAAAIVDAGRRGRCQWCT